MLYEIQEEKQWKGENGTKRSVGRVGLSCVRRYVYMLGTVPHYIYTSCDCHAGVGSAAGVAIGYGAMCGPRVVCSADGCRARYDEVHDRV